MSLLEYAVLGAAGLLAVLFILIGIMCVILIVKIILDIKNDKH